MLHLWKRLFQNTKQMDCLLELEIIIAIAKTGGFDAVEQCKDFQSEGRR